MGGVRPTHWSLGTSLSVDTEKRVEIDRIFVKDEYNLAVGRLWKRE